MEQTIIIKAEKPVKCYYCRFCVIDEYDETCVLTNSSLNLFDEAISEECPFKKDGSVLHITHKPIDEIYD